MLNFHLSVLADVDVRTIVTLLFKVVLNSHVHIEGLVGLILTVRNASFLRRGSLRHNIFNTVQTAFLEQNVRKDVLGVSLLFVGRVTEPVRTRACRVFHFFYKLLY
jgi:hypothetical protein